MIRPLWYSRFAIFILGCSVLFNVELCRATITIDSVRSSPSTCPNNGAVTIFATSNRAGASFVYAIVAGPTLYPQQRDSIFSSLYPGSYTATVHDMNSSDTVQINFTITGNYVSPSFAPIAITPSCPGGANGLIIGNPDTSAGSRPFSWQITSPVSGPPQSSDTFLNLAAGTYVLKLTDGCGNIRTNQVIIGNDGSGLALDSNLEVSVIGCDTIVLKEYIRLYKERANLPLKFTVYTTSGTLIKNIFPSVEDTFSVPGLFSITDTVTNITYGDSIRVCVSDTCNQTICSMEEIIPPFTFILGGYYGSTSNCTSYTGALIWSPYNASYMPSTLVTTPLTFTLTNAGTNAVVDSFTIMPYTWGTNCGVVSPQLPGILYQLTVKDACGNHLYQQDIQWPGSSPAYYNLSPAPTDRGCLDSTGMIYLRLSGFGSQVTIEILSGPAVASSSKPGFAYKDTITYPQVYTNVSGTGDFQLVNMPSGLYYYRVSDSCGNTFSDSLSIVAISDWTYSYSLKKYCGGLGTIAVAVSSTPFIHVDLVGLSTPFYQSCAQGSGCDFSSLLPGQYELNIGFYSYAYPSLINPPNCPGVIDTITVSAYNDSTLKTTTSLLCNGDIYIQLNFDTNNGAPPFQYEIISGPEVFPLQDSSTFHVHSYGTYVVGVVDSCGNSDVLQITVDSARFNPVVKNGNLCLGNRIALESVSSPYYTYIWHKPDGAIFSGDTFVINSLAYTDTGLYRISKIVHINSCTDTFYSTYHLTLKDTFQQNRTLCSGDTFYIGSHAHVMAGVYYDTLLNSGGCDSIVVTSLGINPVPTPTISPSIPPLCHVSNVVLTAHGGVVYSWNNSADSSTIAVNPLIVTTYKVTVTDLNQCSATASVIVYPASDSSVIITQDKNIICVGDSVHVCSPEGFNAYHWNDGESDSCIYAKQAGNYYLTVTNNYGCTANSNRLSVAVYPQSPVAITLNGDTLKEYNQPLCQWYFNDTLIAGATSPLYIATHEGLYSVTIIDSNGCSVSSSKEQVNIPSGLVGLNIDFPVKIYPNPLHYGGWHMQLGSEWIGGWYEIFDSATRLIYKSGIKELSSDVDLSVIPGVYLMRVRSKGRSCTIKLVKL